MASSSVTLDMSLAHPREVFKRALEHSAAKVIIAHNHPSGSLDRSKEDVEVTQKLQAAGAIMGIMVVDHIIVSNDRFVSFKQQKGWI